MTCIGATTQTSQEMQYLQYAAFFFYKMSLKKLYTQTDIATHRCDWPKFRLSENESSVLKCIGRVVWLGV